MDYFDTINADKAFELKYAAWYAKLPDDRKARMLGDLYDFGRQTVEHNLRKTNPFITAADVKLAFIEIHHQDSVDASIMETVRKVCAEEARAEWKARFKKMKKSLGWSYEEMARYTGFSSDSLKSTVSRGLPPALKMAVCVFEQCLPKTI